MCMIIDGSGDIFDFKLSDDFGNKYFYEVYSENLEDAIIVAQKWFDEEYGHKATNVEKNVTGFPKRSCV